MTDIAQPGAFFYGGDTFIKALPCHADELFRFLGYLADGKRRRTVAVIALIECTDVDLDYIAVFQHP